MGRIVSSSLPVEAGFGSGLIYKFFCFVEVVSMNCVSYAVWPESFLPPAPGMTDADSPCPIVYHNHFSTHYCSDSIDYHHHQSLEFEDLDIWVYYSQLDSSVSGQQ